MKYEFMFITLALLAPAVSRADCNEDQKLETSLDISDVLDRCGEPVTITRSESDRDVTFVYGNGDVIDFRGGLVQRLYTRRNVTEK